VGCLARTMMHVRQAKLKSDQNYLQRSMHRFGQKLKIYIYHAIVPFKFPPPHATACRFLRQKNLTPEFCSDGKLSKINKSSKAHINHT
jgi:hypothetical protein